MTDDLRSTLEASVAASETAAAEGTPMPETVTPAATPAPETQKPTFDAQTGKEVTDQATSAQKPATPTGEDPPEVTETDVEKQGGSKDKPLNIERAPQSWKPSEKAKWAALDPGVRSEVVRRERETARVIQEASGYKKFVGGFQEAVKPYESYFRQAGVTPAVAIRNLMATDHFLATAAPQERAKAAAQMLKAYNVDIEMLDSELAGQGRPDPMEKVERLVAERLKPFESFVQQTETQRQTAIQQDYERQVEVVSSMEEDPNYPLFAMVREDMADIIENNLRRGVVLPVGEVYNRAVRMNPEAFSESDKLAKQTKAQTANGAAQRALGASLSVSGGASSRTTQIPASDLRGTIEAAVLAAGGR